VAWGVGKEEGGGDAEDDGDASFDDENEWPRFFSQGLPRFRCVTYQPLYPLMLCMQKTQLAQRCEPSEKAHFGIRRLRPQQEIDDCQFKSEFDI
jgi:hypothetical protein